MTRQVKIKTGLFICFAMIAITLGQTQWTARTSGTLADLRSIVWTGEKLVTVGDSGNIVISEDGVIWEKRNTGINIKFNSVIWTGDKVVAVGDSGTVAVSVDGVLWAINKLDNISNLLFATNVNKRIIVLRAAKKNTDTIMIETNDCEAWTNIPFLATYGESNALCLALNQFFVVGWNGAIISSTNEQEWVLRKQYLHSALHSICWAESRLVVVSQEGVSAYGVVYVSSDGVTWREIRASIHSLYFVRYDESNLITVGHSGTILTSPDAETWTPQTSGTTRDLRCVTFTGTQYVAVRDSGTIITSPADNVPVVHSLNNLDIKELTIKSTANLLTVELPVSLRGSSFSIYSLAGKKIVESRDVKAAGKFTISTGNLAPGVYQLVIGHKGRKLARSFVVNR